MSLPDTLCRGDRDHHAVAPAARGYLIAAYMGLAADRNDFVTAFTITNDGNHTNRTDIVAVRAEAPQP